MFLDIGVPDWRMQNLHNVYRDFIHDEARLSEWNLTDDERRLIDSSEALFVKMCDELEQLNLPDTLNHSDFHPNAMLLDTGTDEINIIDLGEVTIGNPLLPLSSCLTEYLDYRYQVRSKPYFICRYQVENGRFLGA